MKTLNLIGTNKKLQAKEFFKISRFKPFIKKTKPHKHEGYFEMIYITEGKGFHCIETTYYQVNTPDFYFMRPGQLHFWHFTAIPKGYVIMFKEEFFDPVRESNTLQQIQYLLNLKRIPFWSEPSVGQIFEDILKIYQGNSFNAENVIKGCLMVLFSKMSEQCELSDTTPEYPLCNRFLNFLTSQMPSHHKVIEYARELNTSPQNLNQSCKKKLGKTASQLIKEQLILEAKRNLLHTEQNINQIADYLQFNDASYFIKFFKKHTGETPFQFKANYMKD